MSLFAMFVAASTILGQGLTNAGINGKVSDENDKAMPGATVLVVHQPTGTQHGIVSDNSGYFRLPNLIVGGPYTITISFVGYDDFVRSNVYLNLGQIFKISAVLGEVQTDVGEVTVVGYRVGQFEVFDGNRTGAETVIGKESIAKLPTISGDLNDFTRYTPQARVVGAGISIAGMNNRYNSVMIDGTVNNDVFGLAPNGMNGGQTGISAISIETIEQFQITLAPYDVRYGGFGGAGINVVTKSGTNQLSGMGYFKYRSQSLAGKTPTDDETEEREKLADFSAKTYGLNVGGPIIKNKLFFFANIEIQADATPQPFSGADYEGNTSVAELEALRTFMTDNYNHDPGGFENNTRELIGRKAFVRLDWNINSNHQLMLRNQYTYGESIGPSRSNSRNIKFYNSGVLFPSTTNTSALELKSRFSDNITNNLKIGYSYIHDDRNTMGGRFPGVTILDGTGKIYAGGEIYSTGNELKQSIFTITDNFQISKGKHFLTIGTHNEFYGIYNLFMRRAYGDYTFDSVTDFMNGDPSFYRIGYSQVDDIRGDGSAAAAEFNFMQFGIYAQDEFQVNENLKVTAGVRLDIPVFNDAPAEIAQFNDTTMAKLEAVHDMEGAKSGQMPFTQFMISPRVGFNWDVNGTQTTQIRGGVGVFTSRLPLVWPAGSYTNNGLMMGDYRDYGPAPGSFEPDPDLQYVPPKTSVAASGSQIDLYAKDFKLPQMFRANLAVDQKLPGDIVLTLEGIFTKTINNVLWKDVNVKPAWGNATGTGDDRPLFRTYHNGVEDYYGQIMLGTNTNLGYTYNFTAQLRKDFATGLSTSLAYTYGHSESVFDGTSSQNSSQWNYLVSSPVPNNQAELGISSFDMGHRIVGAFSYEVEYLDMFRTMIALFYTGQSGRPVSYIYNDYYGNFVSQAYKGPQLIYIPVNESDIHLVDISGGQTAAQQWTDLDAYISQDDYLNSRRGKYAERNASRVPWENILDLKIVQDVFVNVKDRRQTLQITFDVFNLGNMVNKNWGRQYYASNGNISLIKYVDRINDPATPGSEETLPTFQFYKPTDNKAYYLDDSGLNSSRWQAQLGIRYIF